MRDLGTFPGGSNSAAYGINNGGQVVGYAPIPAEVPHTHFSIVAVLCKTSGHLAG